MRHRPSAVAARQGQARSCSQTCLVLPMLACERASLFDFVSRGSARSLLRIRRRRCSGTDWQLLELMTKAHIACVPGSAHASLLPARVRSPQHAESRFDACVAVIRDRQQLRGRKADAKATEGRVLQARGTRLSVHGLAKHPDRLAGDCFPDSSSLRGRKESAL